MPAPVLRRCARAATALGLAFSLGSCLDIEQNLVLNPDGSGKVTMTTGLAMPGLEGLGGLGGQPGEGGRKLKPREQARAIAVGLLRAEGIEAWSDVTYGVSRDGKTRASATGYFPDVTKVRLSNPLDDSGEKDDLGVTRTPEGNWLIEDSLDDEDDEDDKDAAAEAGDDMDASETLDPSQLTDEEVMDKLDGERQQWAGMKAFMSAFFDSLRIAMSVQGGGTIVDTAIFAKKDERTAVLEFTGKKLVESVDSLLQDDDRAKALIRKGLSPTDSEGGPEEFLKLMFGGDGKMHVTIKPGQPAFNYADAVAAAKAAASPELKALLEEAGKPAREGGHGPSRPGLDGGDEPDADEDEEDEEEAGDPEPNLVPAPAPIPRRID